MATRRSGRKKGAFKFSTNVSNYRWAEGDFEVIVSPLLLAELERVVRRPKFAASIDRGDIDGLLTGLMEDGVLVEDPPADPGLTPDPGDDYLVRSPGPSARGASSRVMRTCGSSRMPCRRSSRPGSSSSTASKPVRGRFCPSERRPGLLPPVTLGSCGKMCIERASWVLVAYTPAANRLQDPPKA
jgi:hypothetical protein